MPTSRHLRKELNAQLVSYYDSREADQISALIIEHFFGMSGTTQLVGTEIHITDSIHQEIRQFITRLANHEPIQYVLGYTEFYGRHFKTDKRALIPRPETEELVRMALAEEIGPDSNILDIGTGTGCIGITMALEKECGVYALDISAEALQLAKDNAQNLHASVNFLKADILNTIPKLPKLDLIISNPPYVPETDRESMELRVIDHEPGQALFVPERDRLKFYERIAVLAPILLKPGGKVMVEIHHTAGVALKELFEGVKWSRALVKKDLNDRDRMLEATLSS